MVEAWHARRKMLHIVLIVNPFASRVTERGLRAVEESLARAGTVDTRLTQRRGHASELAAARFRLEPSLEIDGLGRAAAVLVANCDPYTYAGVLPLHFAPQARFELGLDVVAPVSVKPRSMPRLLRYVLLGHGQENAPDILYGHDLDRLEVKCDRRLPLQVDGEDLGDVDHAIFEAERDAVAVLV